MKLPERQQQIMSVLRGHVPGLRAREIAAAIGLGQQRTTEVLRSLRKAGLLAPTSVGQSARWAETHIAAAIIAERERTDAKERERLRRAREIAAAHARRREAEEQAEAEFIARRPVILPASQAPRITMRSPASVFTMAE